MLQKILRLDGTQQLGKDDQKEISGGYPGGGCSSPKIDCYTPSTHVWSCVLPSNCPW